jgi:ABC-type amino acid transport substrate-binding protein
MMLLRPKNKRLIFVPLIVCCVLFCLPLSVTAQTKLKVGVYQNVPLSFSDEKGAVKGFFIDILEYVAEKEDWAIEYHPDSWAQCLQNLEKGEIDLLGVIAYSPEHAKLFDYTYESVQTEWGQVYTHKQFGIESILDLKFKKIAVLQGEMSASSAIFTVCSMKMIIKSIKVRLSSALKNYILLCPGGKTGGRCKHWTRTCTI